VPVCYRVKLTTGKSRKEGCLLSQQDAEKTCVVTTDEKGGLTRQVKRFGEFLANVREEMKLVHYPTWEQVRSTTLVVVAFIFLFALYLRALDWIFSPLDHWLFSMKA
jgi:preprotein translocase SecE subunit